MHKKLHFSLSRTKITFGRKKVILTRKTEKKVKKKEMFYRIYQIL